MSALDHWQIARARKERLNQGLLTLSSWAASRAAGDHDEDTTLSMLKRKVAELHDAVDRAGWLAEALLRTMGTWDDATESERDAACAEKCRDKAAADGGWGNI
jgi:hypothetical protein